MSLGEGVAAPKRWVRWWTLKDNDSRRPSGVRRRYSLWHLRDGDRLGCGKAFPLPSHEQDETPPPGGTCWGCWSSHKKSLASDPRPAQEN